MKKFTRSAAALLAMTMMVPSVPSSMVYARSQRTVKTKYHKPASTDEARISYEQIRTLLATYIRALKDNSAEKESLREQTLAMLSLCARTSNLNDEEISRISSLLDEIRQSDPSFPQYDQQANESTPSFLDKLDSLPAALFESGAAALDTVSQKESAGPHRELADIDSLFTQDNLPVNSLQPQAAPETVSEPQPPLPEPVQPVSPAPLANPDAVSSSPASEAEFEPAPSTPADFIEQPSSATPDSEIKDAQSSESDFSSTFEPVSAQPQAQALEPVGESENQDFEPETASQTSGLANLFSSPVYAAQADPEIQARINLAAYKENIDEASDTSFTDETPVPSVQSDSSSGDVDFEPAELSSGQTQTIPLTTPATIYIQDSTVDPANQFEDPQNPGSSSDSSSSDTEQKPSSDTAAKPGTGSEGSESDKKPDPSNPQKPDQPSSGTDDSNKDTPDISDDYEGPDWDLDYVGPPIGVKPDTPDNPSSDSANPNVGDQPAQFPKPGETFVPQPDNSYYDPSMPGSPFDVVEPDNSFTDPSLPPGSFTWVTPDPAITSPVITGPSNTIQVRRLMTTNNRKVRVGKLGIINLLPDYADARSWKESTSPYNVPSLWGQCTWFAWGRFYELYGFSPKFYGNGYECVSQLLAAHSDKFEFSKKPKAGAVFSSDYAHNHVGIVLDYNEKTDTLTIQEGNLDGISNTNWDEAISDYRTIRLSSKDMETLYGDVSYAVPKSSTKFVSQMVPESASLKKVSGKIEATLKNLKSLALERIEQKVFVKPDETEWEQSFTE